MHETGIGWLISVSGISAVASATTSMLLRRLCSIIWRQRRMSTTARIVQKCFHVSDICAGTYRLMELSVSMSLLSLVSVGRVVLCRAM